MVRTANLAITMIAALVAYGAGSVAQAADAKGQCFKAGGEATMVTQGLADFMANAALKNSIKAAGATGQGAIDLKCSPTGLLQYCKATQKACK